MEAIEESLVMRGGRRSLPRYSQYHLETEQHLPNQESLRRRAPRKAPAVLESPPVHTSTPQAAADWRNNFPNRSSLDRSGTSSLGDCSLQGDSGYGGLDRSRDRLDSSVPRSCSYPGKEGKGWWGSLQMRLWGRPSFLETGSGVRWRKLEPQQILGFLVLCILVACAGFSFLIVYKHLEGLTAFSNGKYRSLEYRHGSDVTEEKVEEVEVNTEPWPQLSEEALEDFYDVSQDNLVEDVIDEKSLEGNAFVGKNMLEKGTNNENYQIQTSIEEFEIFKLERELERTKEELAAKLQIIGSNRKKFVETPVLYNEKENQEKETQDNVKETAENLVTEELKPKEINMSQESLEQLTEIKETDDDKIKKGLKIKRRRSRVVNPLVKKTGIKLSKAGRMKRGF